MKLPNIAEWAEILIGESIADGTTQRVKPVQFLASIDYFCLAVGFDE